jgi:DNA polymerase-3 subunit alpha
MKQPFIHLHTHSTYSIQDAIGYPLDILKKAEELGFRSTAITDHGNMNAVANLYLNSKDMKIKPIYGCEFYMVPNLEKWKVKKTEVDEKIKLMKKKSEEKITRKDLKVFQDELRKRYHIVLLAKNKTGIKNLYELCYQSNFEGNFYYRPRIDINLIEKYHEGLICTSACLAGYLNQRLEKEKVINRFKDIFGDDLYFEIMMNEMPEQKEADTAIIKASEKYKIPIIYTGDVHYIDKEDYIARDALQMLRLKQVISSKLKDKEINCEQMFLRDYNDVLKAYNEFGYCKVFSQKQLEIFLHNTLEIDEKIETIDFSYKTEHTIRWKNDFDKLKTLCYNSLSRRIEKNAYEKYKTQLEKELKVIYEKDISSYFLLMKIIVDYAKKIMIVGCGRGSAAGCLVSYLLNITEIDPLRFGLYFERFLNIERKELPDIDLDFQYPEKVKSYLSERFGYENVASIASYGTFQIKGLLKDLIRVYEIPLTTLQINKLTKDIDKELAYLITQDEDQSKSIVMVTYDLAYKTSKTLKIFLDKYKQIANVMKILHGQVRHISRHAAGVLVCQNLKSKLPLQRIKNILCTSFVEGTAKRELSKMGFVKLDILGLNALSIINDTLNMINKSYDYIDPDYLNIQDKHVFETVYNKKDYIGIFQFDAKSMRDVASSGKITAFEDLVALNALDRPGPIRSGMHFDFFKNKRDPSKIEYLHEMLKPILKETYGILTYQEQMMQIAQQLANFDLVETNVLRKAIIKTSKEDIDKNEKLRTELKIRFLKGCKENKIDKNIAEQIWELMVKFAGYAFNKAHSVCYAMVGYQMAFLKTYHPKEFYAAVLNNDQFVNYNSIIREMIKNNIKIESVDIRYSKVNFSLKDGKIYWAFSKIKGIGEKAAIEIVRAREIVNFDNLKIYLNSDINWRAVNKRTMDILIRSGAFDFLTAFNNNRKRIIEFYHLWNSKQKNKFTKEQKNDKDFVDNRMQKMFNETKDIEDYTQTEKSYMEFDLLGVNLKYSPFLIEGRKLLIEQLLEIGVNGSFEQQKEFYIVSPMVIREKKDSRNRMMAFVTLIDFNNDVRDGIVFSSNYEPGKLEIGKVYSIFAKIEKNSFLISKIRSIDHLGEKMTLKEKSDEE